MKFNYLTVYVINEHEDGFYISDGNGFVIESEQAIEIGKGLIEFAKKHSETLKEHNIKRDIEFKQELGIYADEMEKCINEKSHRDKSGYVYLFECGGRYKIGYSKDPNRRLKELDNRPFKLNPITRSNELRNAYDIEQELHQHLEKYKINGEWYQLEDKLVQAIKDFLDSLE